jgi:hypothetical protein
MEDKLINHIHAWLIGWGWKSWGANDFEEENERVARAALAKLLLSKEPLSRELRALLAALFVGNASACADKMRTIDRQWLKVFGDRKIKVEYVKPGRRPDLMHRRRVVNAVLKRIKYRGMNKSKAMADAAEALGMDIDSVKRIYGPASKRLQFPMSIGGIYALLFD